jgi:two-component system phosphate regulon sensor histidine kinase PhoR
MRRPALVYVLMAAVIAAAAGLAYYGYRYSRELSIRERAVILDTMRELAEEKIIGIESELIKSANAVFHRVDISNLLELQKFLGTERPAIESVVILDESLSIVPGGFFTKRRGDRIAEFRELLQSRIIADLGLPGAAVDQRGDLHAYYHGRPYLFSYMRQSSGGRTYYVILEADLDYLVSTIFPQFFAVRSPRLYQVVDSAGELVYGFDFSSAPGDVVVELSFVETVDRWRLRVAQREGTALASESSRRAMDLLLIGSALVVILAGLAILLWGLRREQRANELKSEFISNVSHELKTPLSIISMFGEMLALGRTRSAEQATEYAEIIWRESQRLARLIDNVLDFAKIERGVDVYEFAEGDLADVVERAVALSLRRVQGANMTLETQVEPGLPVLRIDQNALTLATLNLIDNAIKYADSGKRIELSLRHEDDRVALEVRDFGPGIALDEQERIFERFYRAHAVRLKPIRGSGIGLALVKHIAEAHHGDVEVTSEPGQGAVFRLWIPAPARG